MKRSILLFGCVLICLTACGKEPEPEEVVPIESEIVEVPEDKPIIYYYEVTHANNTIKFTTQFGVNPYGEVFDYDAYMKLDPVAMFYNGTDFLYVGVTESSDYSQSTVGTLYLSAKDDATLNAFKDSILVEEDGNLYEKLPLPELRISEEVVATRREQMLTGYDNWDVASYAFVTLEDGTEGAVCFTWRVDFMEMVVLGLDSHTCSLRNDNTELLIEDTGEVFTLEFYTNPNYDPYTPKE